MSNNSKTFRLFISSTFSDFQVEREALQTKVFPEIKEYCSSNGYTFQPIDLRWGVSNEAQLDQKALEMCIKEVQSCKRHDYPNFLIMLGYRYGWIPLPNIIEKNEFEQILQNLDAVDKEYVSSWYYEDANQIPTSYILKQRTGEYEEYNKWLEVESKLRDILQMAVSDLDENIKNRYFTSVTESEAIEGIISYSQKSEFQQKLIKLIPDLEQIDHKNIFCFFRDIDKDTIIEDKFISTDYDKAQLFKEQVQEKLIDENILAVSTSQISKDKLDENYLDKFIVSVTNFLKQQIDNQISKDNEKAYSDLELEKHQQEFFKDQKLENFLGQEKILDKILNYISDDNDKPLIICGQSGIGKSSIIAKAIEETSIQTAKKLVYRFIGATPNSTNTRDLLTSILEELNISIEDNNTIDNQNYFLTDIDKEENVFVYFSNKVFDEINNIKDNIVIFIDSVDQLTNDDQFLWLPNKLPSNVKIVISVLKDSDYKQDSKYFNTLEDKVLNYIEIEPFDKPIELLELLLSQQNRTLQLNQKKYFLEQYNKVGTPLYVYMASNQMQYWKSSDLVDIDITLSSSQKNIVKNFIENLTSIHHHDKLLVQKVFGYILASKDGLSEYEILELLNTDKEFIKYLAPETWHINTTQELPLVIWTRLYNHVKPFLSKKNKDGQELLYFFHREFIDAVENQTDQQKEHEKIIEATQELILNHQDQEFDSNRWGKLFISLLGAYSLKYNDVEIQNFCKVLNNLVHDKWIIDFIQSFQELGWKLNTQNKINDSLVYRKIIKFILEVLNSKTSEWLYLYVQSSHNLASTLYRKNQIDNAMSIEKENIDIIENISEADRLTSINFMKLDSEFENDIKNENDFKKLASLVWTDSYLKILSVLSSCYSSNSDLEEAIKIDEKSFGITKSLLFKDPFWIKHYLTSVSNLSESLSRNDNSKRSIKLLEDALLIVENIYDEQSGYLVEDYARILNNLSVLLADSEPKRSQELRIKSNEIISSLYNRNPDRYSTQLHYIVQNNIEMNLASDINDVSEENVSVLLKNINRLENLEKEKWIEEWSNKILINSHECYKSGDLEKSIRYLKVNKQLIEKVYKEDENYWAVFYVHKLIALAKVLNDNKQDFEAKEYQIESLNICERYFKNDPEEWGSLYTKALNNLSITYHNLKLYNDALQIDILNENISKELYKSNKEKWYRAYYHALINISSTYSYLNQNKYEEYKQQYLQLKAEKFIVNPEEFKNEIIELFKNYDNAHKTENIQELLKVLYYLEEFLEISKILYEKDPKWTAPYIEMLNKVSQAYTACPTPQSGKKIRKYANESLKIVKPLAKKYPEQWGKVYQNIKKNKRNMQKILYGTYIFGSIPIIIIIVILYFILT